MTKLNLKLSYKVLLLLVAMIFVKDSSAQFTTGNVVVCRAGDGVTGLSTAAAAVFLDEYTPAGVLVQSVPVPTADGAGGNQTLTIAGSSATECQITRATNGRHLIITGYDAAPGISAVASTSTATVVRVIGRVAADESINTTTTTTNFSGASIRGATNDNGTNLWAVGGNTGVVYTTLGSSGAGIIVSNTQTNFRSTNIFGGQLYVSSGAGAIRLGTVGTGTPTTAGQTVATLPGFPTSAGSFNEFFFADLDANVAGLDTLYTASDSAAANPATATSGGVAKFSLVNGNWTYNGTFPASSAPSIPQSAFFGLTGTVNGTTVTLYATRNGMQLVRFVDTGYNVAPTTAPTLLAAAAPDTAFRGVAFAPSVTTAAAVEVGGRVTHPNNRGIFRAKVTMTDFEGNVRIAFTNLYGYYKFTDVQSGQNYIFTASHRRYQFNQPTQVHFVGEDNGGINFIDSGENGGFLNGN